MFCRGQKRDTRIPSLLSSLFIIMLTLRVSLGRRQRGSLLFHKGRLISAKSVCASLLTPHHSCIVWLPGIREKSLISGIPLETCEIHEWSRLPGGFLTPKCRESLEGELSKDEEGDGERKALLGSELLTPTKPRAVLILREGARAEPGSGLARLLQNVSLEVEWRE